MCYAMFYFIIRFAKFLQSYTEKELIYLSSFYESSPLFNDYLLPIAESTVKVTAEQYRSQGTPQINSTIHLASCQVRSYLAAIHHCAVEDKSRPGYKTKGCDQTRQWGLSSLEEGSWGSLYLVVINKQRSQDWS